MNVSELVVVLSGLGTTCPDARFGRGAARLPHILNGKFALDADSLSREGPAVNSWATAAAMVPVKR